MPSDFLHIKIDDFQFNLLAASLGTQEEAKQVEKAQRKSRMRGK